MTTIRALKRNYKTNLALGRVLPTYNAGIPLPFSTGNPLYDAALTDKLVMTTTMTEAEHLNRGWHLVRNSTPAERTVLADNTRGLLNDYKLLLALRTWELGEDDLTRKFLWAMPWHWRLSFPISVLKPASHIFTGWRRTLKFRLIGDPRYPDLRQLFSELLAKAPPIAILKYRNIIKEAAALQRYRFEGERERAIHDLCFNNGKKIADATLPELEPIPTYLKAREKLRVHDYDGFFTVTEGTELPITAYMGLLGNTGFSLNQAAAPNIEAFRNYAVQTATAVECLLRLVEWSPWLDKNHAQIIGDKVQHGIIERGLNIPFFKITKAFIASPIKVRRLVLEPLFKPLLHHFGSQMAGSLGASQQLTYMQPGNVLHAMSFLLYSILATVMDTRLFLLYGDGMEEMAPIPANQVVAQLANSPKQMQEWLLGKFGGLATQNQYVYHYPAVAKIMGELDPTAPLLLDLPFTQNMDILNAMLPFEQVYNLNMPFGAPGEISLTYEYYSTFSLTTPRWHYGVWERYSDSAATKFAEFLDRLQAFQALAEVA